MPKLGIRAYLLIVLGVLSALPTLVLSSITVSRASMSELERADRQSRTRATAIARDLDQFVTAQTQSIELLAGHLEAVGGLTYPSVQSLISTHRRHSPQLSFVYVAGRDGVSLYIDPVHDTNGLPNAGTSYADRDYYKELIRTGRTTISRVQIGRRSGVPNVQVVAPIRDAAGELIGFAEGSIDLDAIAESIAHAMDGFGASRIVVVDGHGRVLADSVGRLPVLGDVANVQLFRMSTDQSDVRSTVDDRNTAVRVATVRMQNHLGWTVVAIRDLSTVETLAKVARRDALVITVIALAIALLVVAFGVHWLSKPIRALAAATKATGRGDFSKAVPQPRRFEANEIAELLVSVRDMTRNEQHHREETTTLITELETVNDQLRTMVVGIEHAGNAVEVSDSEGRLVYVNPAWEQFTGHTAVEVIGKSFIDLLAIDRTFVVDIWGQLAGGTSWRGIYPSRGRDGKLVEVELNAVPVRRSDGVITHIVATRIDISEQRRAEEVMRMNDRLAAVGTLAAGVAHEINNPLTYINANLACLRTTIESLKSKLASADFDDAIAAFRDTELGVDRVTEIVRDLKQLSRPDERTTTAIDINTLLGSCVRMGSVEIRRHATEECVYGDVPPVAGNEARLSQVFLNLLINAAQACTSDDAAENIIRIVTRSSTDGSQVIVEVTDTGKGIEPDVIEHIFDAFFTTKPIGVGTGLGLSICHGIVKQLGGTITVDSTPGNGSTFRVTLPATLLAEETPPVSPMRSAIKVKILIVDDEPSIATSLARMLRDHDVTTQASAIDALAMLVQQSYDVVLSDIMMPDLNGFALYRRVCEVRPAYAKSFIFMTGGIVQPGLLDDLERLGLPCLHKPFTRVDLLSAVETAAESATPKTAPHHVTQDADHERAAKRSRA